MEQWDEFATEVEGGDEGDLDSPVEVDVDVESDEDGAHAESDLDVRVTAEVADEWNWAAIHAGIAPVRGITVTASRPVADVRVTVTVKDANLVVAEAIAHEGQLASGEQDLGPVRLSLAPAYMGGVLERRPLTCRITVEHMTGGRGPRLLARTSHEVDLQPAALMSWFTGGDRGTPGEAAELGVDLGSDRVSLLRSLTAAFVRPNHPVVREIAADAAHILREATGDASFHAFQMSDPVAAAQAADRSVAAVYEALRSRHITYSEPPPGWDYDARGQLVRDHGDVVGGDGGGLGTCLDTTLLMAAVLEHIGMFPLLVSVPGHIFIGYWRENPDGDGHAPSWYRDEPFSADTGATVEQYKHGRLGFIETTMLCGAEGAPVPDAVRRAHATFLRSAQETFAFITDVAAARRAGVSPLPSVTTMPDGRVQVTEYRRPTASVDAAEPPVTVTVTDAPAPSSGSTRHVDPHPPRVRMWKSALLSLNATSALLNLRIGPSAQRLVLPESLLPHFEDRLHLDEDFELCSGYGLATVHSVRGTATAADLDDASLIEAFQRRVVFFQRPLPGVASARAAVTKGFTEVRNMARKARQARDEKGMNPLFVTIGVLRWSDGKQSGKTYDAPLILVPVHLQPNLRTKSATLRLDPTTQAGPNYALLEWLKRDYGVTIPDLAEPQHDRAGIDVAHVLGAVRAALTEADLPFSVHATASLALLDVGAFRMWQDLNLHADRFLENPLVNHLVHNPTQEFVDRAAVEAPPVDIEALAADVPVEADAAQLQAVAWARQGRTFVLQGPPGTGKSQTITNMIAACVTAGLRVMFVAEKQTALGVVEDRLHRTGLHPFALNLHHEGSTPAKVREQLRRSITAAVDPDPITMDRARRTLEGARRVLEQYPEQLHEVNAAGFSAYSARDHLLSFGPEPDGLPPIAVPLELVGHRQHMVAGIHEAFEGLQTYTSSAGLHPVADPTRRVAVDDPWRLVGPVPASELDLDALSAALPRLVAACERVTGQDADADLRAALLQVTDPAHFALFVAAAQDGVPRGALLDTVLDDQWRDDWRRRHRRAVEAVADGVRDLAGFAPRVLTHVDLDWVRAALVAAGTGMVFTRAARRQAAVAPLLPYAPGGVIEDPAAMLGQLDTLRQLAGRTRALANDIGGIRGVDLPAAWNPFDPDALDDVAMRLARLEAATEVLRGRSRTAAMLTDLARRGLLAPARHDLADLAGAWDEVLRLLQVAPDDLAAWQRDRGLVATVLHHRGAWTERSLHHPDRLDLLRLQRRAALAERLEALRPAGLQQVRADLLDGLRDAAEVRDSFDRALAQASLTERVRATGLDTFDSATHDTQVTRYSQAQRTIRREWTTAGPAKLLSERGGRLQGVFRGESTGSLERELKKTKQLLGTRALLRRHGRAVQQLMPITLISPSAVVDLIEPGVMDFDVVIFDEASQICVPEAIGAMGRGRAIIVVGDSKQMPPTRAIGVTASPDDQELDDDADEVTEDQESILSECELARVPTLRLTWHYRSKDEALIAFSNQQYYDGALTSFPTPTLMSSATGVEFRKVDGRYLRRGQGGLRGADNTNPDEADAIIAEVGRRIAEAPDHRPSLGIVTFNEPQRNHIATRLEELAASDELLRTVMDESVMGRDNVLFVKALEQVQGDERDVILFSVAFSKQPTSRGGASVPLNFGRLSQLGGERRLNVAVTRARRKNVVFCSFEPGDLPAEKSSFLGVRHLRDFLQFARAATPATDGDAATGADGGASTLMGGRPSSLDRHRDDVAAALEACGMVVRRDVGLSDFRLDLLLCDPQAPERPVLPVLLDGPAWQRRASVADRDVLPVDVLSGLMGWPTVARVWWPMWERHRDAAVEQLRTAFAEALETVRARDAAEAEQRERAARELAVAAAQAARAAAEAAAREVPDAPDAPEVFVPSADDVVPPEFVVPAEFDIPAPPAWTQPEPQPVWEPVQEPVWEPPHDPAAPVPTPSDPAGTPAPMAQDPSPAVTTQAATPEMTAGVHAELPPLPVWTGGPVDPVGIIDEDALAAALVEIVAVEGPMLGRLTFRRFVLASGGRRLGSAIRDELVRVLTELVDSGRLARLDDGRADAMDWTVHAPGTAQVVVRARGDRELDEVPPSEVRALMDHVRSTQRPSTEERLYRAVLERYDKSLTRRVRVLFDGYQMYDWRRD